MSLKNVDDGKVLNFAQGLMGCSFNKIKNLSGAHKHAILAKDDNDNLYAVCVCPIEKKEMFLSGIAIRKRMRDRGLPFPKSFALWEMDGYIIEVQEGIKGKDFEYCMHDMNKDELINLSTQISDMVKQSILFFEDENKASRRWGSHLIERDGSAGDLKRYLLNGLNSSIEKSLNKNDYKFLMSMRKLKSFIKKIDYVYAPRDTFLWDVATRNLIIKNGKLAGVIDQDSVKSMDLMIAPAYTHACLAVYGLKEADAYVNNWLNKWNVDEREHSRFLLQRAVAGHYQQAKAGYFEWSGREYNAMDEEKLLQWTEDALRIDIKNLSTPKNIKTENKKVRFG